MCTRPDSKHGAGQRVEVADILRTHGVVYNRPIASPEANAV